VRGYGFSNEKNFKGGCRKRGDILLSKRKEAVEGGGHQTLSSQEGNFEKSNRKRKKTPVTIPSRKRVGVQRKSTRWVVFQGKGSVSPRRIATHESKEEKPSRAVEVFSRAPEEGVRPGIEEEGR